MPHQCTNCGRTFADGSKEMLSGCPDCGGNKFQFAPATATTADSSAEAADSGTADTDPVDGAPSGDAASAELSDEPDSVTTRATATVREWITGDDSDSAAERDRATAESATQSSPDDAAAGADRSWPSSDAADAAESDDGDDGSFAEWPETARRPEDRTADSSATDADADEPARSSRGSDRATATTTLADDENSAQADARSEVVPADDLPAHDSVAVSNPDTVDVDEATTRSPADTDRPPEHGRVVSEPSGDQPSIEDLRKELNKQFESIKILRPGQYELNLMELYNREEYIISLQEDGRYVIDVPDSWRDGDGSDE